MFVYYYRIFDRYRRRPLVSLAVLGDDNSSWRPNSFLLEELGCRHCFEFPMVKLLDYETQVAMLEQSANPFAALVLAHLKTQQTSREPVARLGWKVRIIKNLFESGLGAEEIRQLFRLIDWLMELPREQELLFKDEIHRLEEGKKMPYVTSVERLAHEEGFEKGIEKGIEKGREEGALAELRKTLLRLGSKRLDPPEETAAASLQAIADLTRPERMSERLLEVATWSDLLATP